MNEDRYFQPMRIYPTLGYPKPLHPLDRCAHGAVVVLFNRTDAMSLTSAEIRERYPRYSGMCPDCKQTIVKYASSDHYLLGDW